PYDRYGRIALIVKRYYGTLWYEDVCKYFGISKEEAVKRATSPNRKSKL
ncbi:unnamed protein product, partial [marine sediment metagenome]